MSKCEPARFHSAGSKSFFIASVSKRPVFFHVSLASVDHSCIERSRSSLITSVPGGGSPCIAEGDGLPSAHAWKRLFWFSFQNLSHSLPCCSKPFIAPPENWCQVHIFVDEVSSRKCVPDTNF